MKSILLLVALMVAVIPLGCMPVGGGGDIEDIDGDGFPDLDVPEGVNGDSKVGIEVVNEITRAQVLRLLSSSGTTGLEGVINLVTIRVTFDFTLSYANGEQVTHSESRQLGAFDFRFSGACPETIETVVSITATAPFVGTVFSEPNLLQLVLSQDGRTGDGQFECERVMSVLATFDEDSGQPDISFTIEDF